jgi:endonuclease YncB( thermonuclease family)
MSRRISAGLFLSLAFAGLAVTCLGADSFSGTVAGISDGDTIRVMRDGKAERVRLWGIDCPEGHQAFGARAKQFTSDLAFGKEVTVQIKDVDRYKRLVGEVILPDGRNLNRELVAAGLAWWYRQYARSDRELERLEGAARAAKRGLWTEQNAVAPWEFRKMPRERPAETTAKHAR